MEVIMIIRMNNDLKEQKIYANGDELATVMGFDREDKKRVVGYPLIEKCLFIRLVILY